MASPTSTYPALKTRSAHQPDRSWPSRAKGRVPSALALAVPFVLIAVREHTTHFQDDNNRALERSAAAIHWGDAGLSWIGRVYPPLPTAAAALLPSLLGLSILGALCAGAMLEAIAFRLATVGLRLPAIIILIGALGLTPSFAYTATTDFTAFAALTLLVLAIDGYVRFAVLGQTHGGFQAGLAIGLAGLCNPSAVVMAVGFAAAVRLVANERFKSENAAGRASAAVLLFPTVAALLGWVYLCWRFGDGPLAWLHRSAPDLIRLDWSQIGSALATQSHAILLTPVFLLSFIILLVRRPVLAVLLSIPLVCVVIAVTLGLPFTGLSTAVLLGVLGLTSLRRDPEPRLVRVLLVVAVLGCAAKWLYHPLPAINLWEHAIGLR